VQGPRPRRALLRRAPGLGREKGGAVGSGRARAATGDVGLRRSWSEEAAPWRRRTCRDSGRCGVREEAWRATFIARERKVSRTSLLRIPGINVVRTTSGHR
jgi:hypothetical protein